MHRKSLALIAILTLTISTIGSLQIDIVSANYYPPPSIEIFSPLSAPGVYNESSVQLYVRVNALPSGSSSITHISYCLDGKANITLTNIERKDGEWYWTSTEGVIAAGNAFSVKTTLDNLAEGNHTLVVYSHAADGTEMSQTRTFMVDYDYVPPENPFGLPSNLPNGTATPTTTPITQTPNELALLLTLLVLVIVAVSGALLVSMLAFKRKNNRIT